MIRTATSDDIPTLTILIGNEFLRESGYADLGVTANPFKIHSTLETLLDPAKGSVLVAEISGKIVGAIALARYELYFSDAPMAMELAWWMHPDHRNRAVGARLLMGALDWAKTTGVQIFSMVDLPRIESNAAKMYERLGGQLMERTWVWRM